MPSLLGIGGQFIFPLSTSLSFRKVAFFFLKFLFHPPPTYVSFERVDFYFPFLMHFQSPFPLEWVNNLLFFHF
jgi:hypothetical protein